MQDDVKDALVTRVLRSRERCIHQRNKLEFIGRENLANHGYFSLGYYLGRISAFEAVLDELGVDYGGDSDDN